MAWLNNFSVDSDLKKRVLTTDFEERVNRAVNSFLQQVDQMLEEETFEGVHPALNTVQEGWWAHA
ncbi:MAG: hypothetical protein HQM12_05065 [SAR324 cluster bacterium]|nr:hypothetical protein [SAR324 cluster bacterium]